MAAANGEHGTSGDNYAPVASTSAAGAAESRPKPSRQHSSYSARHRAGSSQSHAHTQSNTSARSRGTLGTAGRPPHHRQALSAIRAFLRRESCFDILPESFRLIVLDNKLLIKRALIALQTNGEKAFSTCRSASQITLTDLAFTSYSITLTLRLSVRYATLRSQFGLLRLPGIVSAPLYDSSNYQFAGMFTMVDVIHLIQYYYLSATGYDNAAVEVESVDLSALRGKKRHS